VDVNGTRFQLLLGPRDWRPLLDAATAAPDERLEWDPDGAQVTLRRELSRFPPSGEEAPPAAGGPRRPLTPARRRGATRDRFGHFYWIAESRREIRYRPASDRESAVFWSADRLADDVEQTAAAPGAFAPCAPPPAAELPHLSGLAVTERHFLVVGTREPDGLLVFDLHASGPPVWMRWPAGVPFAPFDISAAPGGGVWILDRPGGGAPARLWRLGRDLRVVRTGDELELGPAPPADAFRPLDDGPGPACEPPARTFPAGIALDLASPPVPGTGDAVAVASLPDGTALVMEVDVAAGDTWLHRWTLARWDGPGTPASPASLAHALAALLKEPTALVGHAMAFVPDPAPDAGLVAGKLFVGDRVGHQAFAFRLSTGMPGTSEAAVLEVSALASFYPMRGWAGRGLVAGTDGEAYYDLADSWLPLTKLPRRRYASSGFLDHVIFDGKEPSCVWHRLLLDACIPPGDAVEIDTRAAETEAELETAPWRREPAPRLRPDGPELPWTIPPQLDPTRGIGTWELLFQEAVGRFIELRLTLRGSGRSSPKLRALRAHYPRFSYLRYLPAAYREDAASASFLDRFLANFEGFFTELEGRIAAAEVLFGMETAPPEALDWLAEWFGAVLDGSWDERRRRLFLANAAELYRRRGTRAGILAAVRLAADACPPDDVFAADRAARPFGYRLVEAFRGGDPAGAHRFTVLVPADLSTTPVQRLRMREAVAAIVERERPAHAEFDVQLYWALLRVGSARVGRDTALGEGNRVVAMRLGAGYLGQATLAERQPWPVADRRVVGRDRTGFPPPLA
jgi:phage tail-like protein